MRCFTLATAFAAVLCAGSAVAAPSVSVNFSRETGVAPFDGNNAPGNDSSASNSVIRTNDVISYKFEVVVADDDATNIVLRLQTGPGLDLELPAFCRETGVAPVSSISGSSTTGYSVVCNVGDISEGSQVLYAMPATVVPEAPNGSTVTLLAASIESDQTAQQSFPGATDTVSARPMLDLIKNDHTRLMGRRAGPAGEDGVVYTFSVEVATQNQARGSELVTGVLSFTDDLSGISPNARLFQGWTGAPTEACAPNYSGVWQRLWHNPYAYVRTADGGPGGAGSGILDRSVWNSGTINCTDPGPGGTTNVTITGADLTGNHFPSRTVANSANPANTRFLASHAMAVWIPLTDIQAAGGELSINNVYSNLVATSVSGQANVEPDTNNNRRSFIARDGGSGRWFYNHRDHNTYALVQSQTSRRSGDGYVLPGQVFATRHYQNNDAWLTKQTLDNNTHCTTFDNSTQIITEITSGQGAKVTFDGVADGTQPPATIEYGTGAFGRTETCEDGDSPAGWYTDINMVPGGAAAITKVRASVPYLAAPGGSSTTHRMNLITRFTALDNPPGTIVSEFGTFKNDQQNSGNWIISSYDDSTALGNYGDRLFLTKAVVRIDKDSVPSGENQALAGDPLSFTLQPSLTSPTTPPQLTSNVTVTDTLPPWYQFVLGSAVPTVSNFTNNPDGTTTLVWEFPGSVINDPMSAITYDVNVTPTTPDQTAAVNSVVISSPNDGSPESVRTDTHSVLVLNPAGFSVSKTAAPILVSPDNTFSYELTYANTGTSDFAGVEFIDVLPNLSVAQSPPTSFSGSTFFVSATGTNGETFEYSKNNPTTIDDDPTVASNQPGGSTIWCTAFSGGACPANPAEVTAVRGISPAFLQGQPPRVVTITMDGDGNDAFNAYSNRFTAKADGLAFPVTSQTATVFVRTADVSLEKTVSGPDPLNPTLVTFVVTTSNDGPHTAEGMEISDALPSGYTYYDHSGAGVYNPSTGIWLPGNVPVGGSRSFTMRAEVVPGGDYTNVAEVTSQLYADPDSTPGNGDLSEDDIASAYVTRLSGLVFLDNGTGGGTAHDGVQNGSETGGRYGTITLSDTATGTAQVVADVAADGSWSAILATGLPGEFEAVFTPDPDYYLMSEGATGLPALINADTRDGRFTFTPGPAAEYTNLDFGLVAKPLLSQSQTSSINAGQIISLAHRYEATSSGIVNFSLVDQIETPAGGFTSTIFTDTDCDGVPESPLLTGVPVVEGQSVCLVVRTQAGSGVGANSSVTYGLVATTDFSGVSITHEARNDDTLTVGGSNDEFVIRKLVRNVTAGTPETTVNSGGPGDVLEYRLILTNPAAFPATDVTVSDLTPAWTALAGPIAPSTTFASGTTCTLSVPTTALNVLGYAGALHWTCPGTFPAGAEGSLTFQVEIAP